MSARTIRLFHDIHMGLSHDGLRKITEKEGIKLEALPAGNILMFINRKMDKLKIMGSNGIVVGYLKMPGGHRISLSAIQYIPATFGANGELSYPAALRKSLEQRLQS